MFATPSQMMASARAVGQVNWFSLWQFAQRLVSLTLSGLRALRHDARAEWGGLLAQSIPSTGYDRCGSADE